MADYDQACRACEKLVVLTRELHRSIRNSLKYDKRRDGSRGRCTTKDFPSVDLRKGDRLEPCAELPDVGAFELIDVFPVRALFWRRADETRTRHRLPLFDPRLGITLHTIMIDQLHAMNLGVLQNFCAYALWRLAESNVYDLDRSTKPEYLVMFCLRLKRDLFEWYRVHENEFAPEDRSRLVDLVPTMLGDEHSPSLKTKAAETRMLVWFCGDMINEHSARIPDAVVWVRACDALKRMLIVFKSQPRVVAAAAAQDPARDEGLLNTFSKFVFVVWRMRVIVCLL